jgi:O-acetyl-ADP-ribose deacetylase (regulator of RNase III)
LATFEVEAVVRPIRADLAPVNAQSRDLAAAGGERLEARLESVGSIPLGGAVITPGGDLPASFVIHVVVMSSDEPQSAATVQRAVRNGLRRAADWEVASLALPPIGLGVGTMEAEESARALVEILFDHLDEGRPPQDLTIVVTSEYEATLFSRLVAECESDRTS